MTAPHRLLYSDSSFSSYSWFLLLLLFPCTVVAADKPNVVVIVGDDMGYADVGFHGGKEIPTPHLDALAKSGVKFTSGYVSGPYCSPTRAGLLTGRYQTRFGHEFNPGGMGPRQGLPLTESTLADRLKAAGYRTALVGKWHLGNNQRHPQKRGFDDFFGFLGGAHDYFKPDGKSGVSPARLYNLKDDIGEATDLSAKNPDKVKELRAAWDEWNKGNVAPLWGGGKAP